jgi:hypothetical protein
MIIFIETFKWLLDLDLYSISDIYQQLFCMYVICKFYVIQP